MGRLQLMLLFQFLNLDVGHECPFCLQRETVFHAFMQCSRLEPLFTVLQNLFCVLVRRFLLGFLFVVLNMFRENVLNVNF